MRMERKSLIGCALIVLSAVVAMVPSMLRGVSCGHDFDFHLVSWFDALHSWREGILYPHWTPSANYGAGEPRFVFYPPLTWMMGAALGAVLPWKVTPVVLSILLLAATGLATRALARQAFSEGVATLAGCTAIFCGYTLFTAYERSAFAEMTGGFWAPLLLLLMLRDLRGRPEVVKPRVLDGTALGLTLIVAGAWLSNAPVGVMLSYLLATVALAVAVMTRSWAPALRAAIAAGVGIGLSAAYLIPAAWEQKWVAIRQAIDDPGLLIENSWLFARHANPSMELHDIELIRVSFIAVTMVLVALAAVAVAWWRRSLPESRGWWMVLAVIPLVVLLLQLPISLPVWNLLPKLRFLQFPWRWLLIVEAPMAIFFAAAVWNGKRWWRIVVILVCVGFFAGTTLVSYASLFQSCDASDSVQGRVADYKAGVGFEGTDEYAPTEADNSLIATGLPAACLVNDPLRTLGQGDPDMTPDWSPDQGTCEATYADADPVRHGATEHRRIVANVPHPGYLVLRLRTYPAWTMRMNGVKVAPGPARQDGLMTVRVPQGPIDLTVDWTTTRDVWAGRWVSVVALLLVTCLGVMEQRRLHPRLK